jgi:hypothetical protein
MKKRMVVAMVSALALTLVIAGVAGAAGPVPYNGGHSYQPQLYYNYGYAPNTGQPAYAYPGLGTNRGTPAYTYPGNGNNTNRGTPAYTYPGNGNNTNRGMPAYAYSGNGTNHSTPAYTYTGNTSGVCNRFGGGYGYPCRESVTQGSGGWSYWGR